MPNLNDPKRGFDLISIKWQLKNSKQELKVSKRIAKVNKRTERRYLM